MTPDAQARAIDVLSQCSLKLAYDEYTRSLDAITAALEAQTMDDLALQALYEIKHVIETCIDDSEELPERILDIVNKTLEQTAEKPW